MAGPTSEELLDELHRLREELDKTPSSTDMNEVGEYWASTYHDHFGTWNNALREAGFEPNQEKKIPTDDLLNELTRLARCLNKTPTKDQMDEVGEYYGQSYQLRFGSWNEAVHQAGLEPNHAFQSPSSETDQTCARFVVHLLMSLISTIGGTERTKRVATSVVTATIVSMLVVRDQKKMQTGC